MKKLFYPQWHLWCFCQNDQTESANPTTNAIAKRGCVLAAQLAATWCLEWMKSKLLLKSEVNTPFSKRKIEILLLLMYCTEPQLRTFQTLKFNPKLMCWMTILMQQILILIQFFSGVAKRWNLFCFRIRKATTKTSWTRDVMKQTKRGGLDPTTKLNIWACTIGGGILGRTISWRIFSNWWN
jgi:hypothetical protein